MHEDHEPYLTCWIALDDVTEENGAVSLLPYSRSGIKSYIKHIPDPVVNDQVCYFGSDPGIQMTAPAGSIVVFSSVVIHRSGPNLTEGLRRVYLAQYPRRSSPRRVRRIHGDRSKSSFTAVGSSGRANRSRPAKLLGEPRPTWQHFRDPMATCTSRSTTAAAAATTAATRMRSFHHLSINSIRGMTVRRRA